MFQHDTSVSRPQQPKLLQQVRDAIRARHYSICTEEVYVQWSKRFILFHLHYRRSIMHRLTLAMCWLILGTGLALAYAQPAEDAQKQLQGTWTATQAKRDGHAADDVVGHRLAFTDHRFQIQSEDGKPLYAGIVRVDPSTKPAAIDYEHTEGVLKGKVWQGINALDGDTLKICDNASNLDKGRPVAFEATSGSGYVLITFKRAQP